MSETPPAIFISHAHADNELCDRYVAALKARGVDAWYDRNNAQFGHFLSAEIQRELERRPAFLLLLTQHALDSFWVQLEMQAYLGLMAKDRSRMLLAVRIDPCDVPPFLNALLWIDALNQPFEASIAAIASALGMPGTSREPIATDSHVAGTPKISSWQLAIPAKSEPVIRLETATSKASYAATAGARVTQTRPSPRGYSVLRRRFIAVIAALLVAASLSGLLTINELSAFQSFSGTGTPTATATSTPVKPPASTFTDMTNKTTVVIQALDTSNNSSGHGWFAVGATPQPNAANNANIIIKIGTMVTWSNKTSGSPQTVVEGIPPAVGQDFGTANTTQPIMPWGSTDGYSYMFTHAGEYSFYCGIFPAMSGWISVVA